MMTLMLFAYRRAIGAQGVLADIQTQTDYREKEGTILRSFVAIIPNRAIRAMQSGSDSTTAKKTPLKFQEIFNEVLNQSNARTSISTELRETLNLPGSFSGNSGDSKLDVTGRIFKSIIDNTGNVTGGLNRNLGTGFPPALSTNGAVANDDIYPIITNRKEYGSYATGQVGLSTDTYKAFNLIPYPQISFGYAKPGDLFVAKRNWWAFTMDLADHDDTVTKLARFKRTFVLSIYEIPSQLPISASSFMALGQHANGQAWGDVTITGNVFAGRALVEGSTALGSLSSRRRLELSSDATIGGQSFTGSPFTPGVRETYRLTEGDFFPVSLASESGNAAFIAINRGADYFDRFAHSAETATVSPTTWNNYSVGALQCAMRLDITKCVSAADRTPTELKFSYMKGGSRRTLVIPLDQGVASGLPVGYIDVADENQAVYFDTPVDVAYGAYGTKNFVSKGYYYYKDSVSGTIRFDNPTFGDPLVGTRKRGYFKPLYPFEIKSLPSGKICVAVYPERFKTFMTLLGADSLEVNKSLAINVDYVNSTNLTKPLIPCTATDYGVIIEECRDFTTFTKGFSLVTNLRLHIGDDFNIVPTTPPAGYTPPNGASFYPPCSLFSPEKRYGVDIDPFGVELSGQVGSVASENATNPIRPLDATGVSGTSMTANQISVNLSKINHPAELPPITMMNWLVVVEEKRNEFD